MKTGESKIISIDNLTIGYPGKGGSGKIVREGISLDATGGELIALIGGNGAGKSTLLRTIAGFQSSLAGNVVINDQSIETYREKELAKILSFVSTETIKVSNLTVFELIALGRYPHTSWSGRLSNEDREKVEEAIGIVGLRGYENRMVNFISDGERQKAMIARTLAQDTDIILLDEPTAFLDLSNKYDIVHILHRLANEEGKTILFSTHDLTTAIAECDKVWLMLEDTIREGSPEDLVLDGSFSSLFHNNNLWFDTEKGDYRIKKEAGPKAYVSGEGIFLNWTIKAVERTGYTVIEKTDTERLPDNEILEIEVSYPRWNVRFHQAQTTVDSLYDLCRYLKVLND